MVDDLWLEEVGVASSFLLLLLWSNENKSIPWVEDEAPDGKGGFVEGKAAAG